ncbi:MAG: hypothetical protein IT426_12215 [Pirellulales bacterium]|nr:hypothetical protein [Pirellulales bacterium]
MRVSRLPPSAALREIGKKYHAGIGEPIVRAIAEAPTEVEAQSLCKAAADVLAGV